MTPQVQGKTHLFAEHGLYDGLFLMRDEESGTYWDHLTGEAVYGDLVGQQLEVSALEYSVAGQVLENHPQAVITISDQALRKNDDLELEGLLESSDGRLGEMFSSTIAAEDDRLPTMELGMGIWKGKEARFYPYETITSAGGAILDQFEGRGVLIYLDPEIHVLSALYTEARTWGLADNVIELSTGQRIANSVLVDHQGDLLPMDRPLQIFTRWYGFALTFPGTEIHGQ